MAKNVKELNAPSEKLQQGMNDKILKISIELAASGHFAVNICKGEEKSSTFQNGIDVSHNTIKEHTINSYDNMLLIHGIEEDNSDIYEVVLDLFKNKLNVQVEKEDLKNCYRLGQAVGKEKPKPIVVDFALHELRNSIFYAKKKLKGSKIGITDRLTNENLLIYKIVREIKEVRCWTKDGKVVVSYNGEKRVIATTEDVNQLLEDIQRGKTDAWM